MIQQLVEPAFLRARIVEVRDLIQKHRAELEKPQSAIGASAAAAGVSPAELREAEAALTAMLDDSKYHAKEEEAAWMGCASEQGIVQSALEEFYTKAGAVEQTNKKGLAGSVPAVTDLALKPDWVPTSAKGLFRQAEESDVLGWSLSFAVAKGIALLRGKALFIQQRELFSPLADKARLILFGDWASGIPRARDAAARIRKKLDENPGDGWETHVIHLGDVYYSGRGFEYTQHLSERWPVLDSERDEVGSWCLNGNHDMFTGGHGYFEFLSKDTRFARQKGASYFCLENGSWQIFGLDTAYESEGMKGDAGGLQAPQREFIEQRRAAAPEKKVIFLSHHQLFSGYENGSPLLEKRIAGMFSKQDPITAWFWGHEHRCAVYYSTDTVRYASLVGHGGVPVYASKKTTPASVRYEYKDSFLSGFERFARLGFAILKLDGENASVEYVNELGTTHEAHSVPWPQPRGTV